MIRALKKYFKLPFRDKLLLGEAITFLFLAKLLILVLPFKHCIKTFNNEKCVKQDIDIDLLRRIRNAISRANKLAFWKNICLVKSFAGKWMLQRRKIPSKLFLGVNIDDKKELVAHAWLKVDEFEVTHDGGKHQKLHVL